MRCLLLVAAVFGLSSAVQCPNNFNDDGSGICFSPIILEAQRTVAYRLCAQNNASLYVINNAFMNNRVQSMATNADRIWLGLTCLNSTITSCTWDNGNVVTTNAYTNFLNGNPDPTAGACVYMQVSNGKWYSAPCSNIMLWMGCQYTPGAPTVPHCLDKTSSYFNGKCYFELSASDYDSASNMCKAGCGSLASIHNDGGNSFVRDFTPAGQDALLIGLARSANKNYYWDDGSSYDYSNFGREDGTLGNCVSMLLKDTAKVKRGQWTNAPCNLTTASNVLCEKNLDNICDQLATAPTQAPLLCNGIDSRSGHGFIYSPGFPRSSEENTCEYRLYESTGQQAYIKFSNLSLDGQSSISLYNSFNTTAPFTTLTNLTNTTGDYYSTGSQLRIVYNTDGAPSTSGIPVNVFSGEYGYWYDYRCPSNAINVKNSGTFTTPNYPSNYDQYSSSTWCLTSSKKRVQLTFEYIMLYILAGNVSVRDGNGQTLLQLSGGPLSNLTVTSVTDYVTVSFSPSNSYYTARGFKASFISID